MNSHNFDVDYDKPEYLNDNGRKKYSKSAIRLYEAQKRIVEVMRAESKGQDSEGFTIWYGSLNQLLNDNGVAINKTAHMQLSALLKEGGTFCKQRGNRHVQSCYIVGEPLTVDQVSELVKSVRRRQYSVARDFTTMAASVESETLAQIVQKQSETLNDLTSAVAQITAQLAQMNRAELHQETYEY